eukprot:TRINITY_DN1307_c0_g1_i1.p1 TRINITY_DN1307_c0_g1~~TRINITY_DN1307_c0_g1_i1.p1  ORF type:complete len:108 (+),score=17.73 TRINITY_DN1307_c0_g1_i1:73-396(+)
MARSSSPLMSLILCCAGVAFFLIPSPAFIPGSPMHQQARAIGVSVAVAAPATFGMPMVASAQEELADGIPEPVLGIGMLSVIVVLVLITSGIVVARGLIADEENGDF